MNQPSCFTHNHMTCRQYGLWTRIRELQHRSGYVYFDADFLSANFQSTSRDVIYDDCSALLASGWFILTEDYAQGKSRRKGGLFKARKIHAVSHKDWVVENPAKCMGTQPSGSANSLTVDPSTDRQIATGRLGNQRLTVRQIATDGSANSHEPVAPSQHRHGYIDMVKEQTPVKNKDIVKKKTVDDSNFVSSGSCSVEDSSDRPDGEGSSVPTDAPADSQPHLSTNWHNQMLESVGHGNADQIAVADVILTAMSRRRDSDGRAPEALVASDVIKHFDEAAFGEITPAQMYSQVLGLLHFYSDVKSETGKLRRLPYVPRVPKPPQPLQPPASAKPKAATRTETPAYLAAKRANRIWRECGQDASLWYCADCDSGKLLSADTIACPDCAARESVYDLPETITPDIRLEKAAGLMKLEVWTIEVNDQWLDEVKKAEKR